MPIVTIVLVLLSIGFLMWILQSAPIPVHPWIRTVIMGLVGFFALIWILNMLGVHTGIPINLR